MPLALGYSVKKKIKTWFWTSVLFSTPLLTMSGTHAAGLGRLNVISTVGQPLQAEVELLDVNPEDAKSIKAKIGSKEAYNAAGLKGNGLDDVNIEVKQKNNGSHYLSISSNKPMNESFLNLLVEAEGANGAKFTRDYSVLLDPNKQDSKRKRTTQQPATEEAEETETTSSNKKQSKKTRNNSKGNAYRVKQGDTLSKIALQNKSVELSLDQMLVVLYENNRNAFVKNNMNNLKSGVIIRIPKEGEVKAPTRQAAKREVRLQADDWHGYRQKVASSVITNRNAQQNKPEESVSDSGKITPKVNEGTTKPKGDILKLSGPNGTQGKNDAQQVQTLQEENLVKEKALKEANDRIQILQRNLEEMKRLLVLRNDELAKMQATAQAKPKESKPEETPPVTPPTDWMTKFTSDPVYIGAGIAALLAGLGLFAFARKRKKEQEEAERKRQEAHRRRQAEEAKNYDNDDSIVVKPVHLGSRKLDPLTEIDILCSNGRYDDAIQRLNDEIVKTPRDFRLYHKLLEIYKEYKQDKVSFEREARGLLDLLGSRNDPNWEKAAAMGRIFDPANPLYQQDFSEPTPIKTALAAEDKFDKTIEINGKDFADLYALDNSKDYNDSSVEAVPLPDFDPNQTRDKNNTKPQNSTLDDIDLPDFAESLTQASQNKAPRKETQNAAGTSDDFDIQNLFNDDMENGQNRQTGKATGLDDMTELSDFDALNETAPEPKKVDVTKKAAMDDHHLDADFFSKSDFPQAGTAQTTSLDDTMNKVFESLPKENELSPPPVNTILGDMQAALAQNSEDGFADLTAGFDDGLDFPPPAGNKGGGINDDTLDFTSDFELSGEKKPTQNVASSAAPVNTAAFNDNLMIASGDIDMREYENAKKLLLPILEHGDPDQKEMAEELMSKIPNKNK